MANVAVVSFRLGGTDGVSIESAKWCAALTDLGHRVTTVAGEGPVDRLLPGLALHATTPPTLDEFGDALDDADLVLVENLASLPLNVAARDQLYRVLEGRPALFHHHDLAWQRPHLAHLEGPRDAPTWHHVTINELSRRELAARGISATTIYNSFDCAPALGRRDETRARLGVGDERLVVLPTRALARKNLPGAITLSRDLGATLWLLGPAEDGFDNERDRLVRDASIAIVQGRDDDVTMSDVYAAADLVVMPSTWEGFGNPVLESVTYRRPLALHYYPVAREIAAHGFRFFDLDDVTELAAHLDAPDPTLYDHNLAVARRSFNLEHLASRLAVLLKTVDASLAD